MATKKKKVSTKQKSNSAAAKNKTTKTIGSVATKRKSDNAVAKNKKTIGSVAEAAIKSGKTNEQALSIVKRSFPKSKANLQHMSWYRNKLRNVDGVRGVKTQRELNKKKAA